MAAKRLSTVLQFLQSQEQTLQGNQIMKSQLAERVAETCLSRHHTSEDESWRLKEKLNKKQGCSQFGHNTTKKSKTV